MIDADTLTDLQHALIEHRPRLLRFIAALGQPEDAEDVLHDLWQRLEKMPSRQISEPVGYLFRAAENLVRDRRRSGARRDKRQRQWHDAVSFDTQESVAERAIIAREQLEQAEAVLRGLGPRVDLIFRRFRIDGISQAEIAQELGISLSSVEKDLRKGYVALAALRSRFDAD
jgi:RNA polymerase sigma factor (sigma-70 family)